MAKIVEMLTPFASDERQRIITASLTLLGETTEKFKKNTPEESGDESQGLSDLSPRAKTWAKQNNLSTEELQQVFLITEGNAEVIAVDVPGKNKKEKTHNAYVLVGIAKLLSSGDPSFDDKSARALCETSGCYDSANHAASLRDKGNEFTGTKDKGWTLTTPGLKRGAILIKELNK